MSTHSQIDRALRRSHVTLRKLGLRSLVLFGSAARETTGPKSDVDLLYEFEPGEATLDHLLSLQDVLESALGRRVDLVPKKYLGPILESYIVLDAIPVYDAATVDEPSPRNGDPVVSLGPEGTAA